MENRFENTPEEQRAAWRPPYETPPGTDPPQARALNDAYGQGGLCARVRDMLPPLLENDGDVRPEMASAVYAHLSACAVCSREFGEMQRVVSLLEAMPPAEMPLDFSNLIMQRIQNEAAPPLRAFAAPRPQEERKGAADAPTLTAATSQAATILGHATGQTTHTTLTTEARQMGFLQQVTLACVLSAVMAFFVSTAWGQRMLGGNVVSAAEWLGHLGETLRQIPVLGWLVQFVFAALSQIGAVLEQAYSTLGETAVRGLALDAALCAAGCYFLVARRQRGPMRGA